MSTLLEQCREYLLKRIGVIEQHNFVLTVDYGKMIMNDPERTKSGVNPVCLKVINTVIDCLKDEDNYFFGSPSFETLREVIKELAKEVDVTFQQVQKYNNGLNAPHAKTLKHFAKYFDVSMDDLCDPDFIKKKYQLVPMTEDEEYSNAGITKEEIGMNSPEMKEAKEKIKELQIRLAEALEVDEAHQKQMGKLQVRLTEVEKDNQKLAHQVEDLKLNHVRKAGL